MHLNWTIICIMTKTKINFILFILCHSFSRLFKIHHILYTESFHSFNKIQFNIKFCLFLEMRSVRHLSAYVKGPSVPPLSNLTIPAQLRTTVERFPDKEAAVFSLTNQRITFEHLENDTNRVAAGLIASGLKKGDRLGIWSPNHYEWILTQFAAAKAGLILVNINPSYRPKELAYALEKCQIKECFN